VPLVLTIPLEDIASMTPLNVHNEPTEPAPVKIEKKGKKDKKTKAPDERIGDSKMTPLVVFHPISYVLELQFTNSVG
jgi:hypothetical protein